MALRERILKNIGIAIAYIVLGKLGLMLAVPPGYATIIWPPSGLAIGALIVCGRMLLPGIFIGSLALNCYVGWLKTGAFGMVGFEIATCIALGSTLQAWFAYYLTRRFMGLPLSLNRAVEVARLFLLCGPVACLVAATVGVGTLYAFGALDVSMVPENWLTWWQGDVIGVLVVMPLVLMAPVGKERLKWRGKTVGALPLVALLTLTIPLGLTFYGWKIASEQHTRHADDQFQALVAENQAALQRRLDSYQHALLGAAGFWESSDYVSPEEWRTYVETLDIATNLPGIGGIGYIRAVPSDKIKAYEALQRKNNATDFTIHPPHDNPDHYVITYIEPYTSNAKALGLDIGFEQNRREVVELTRRSGHSAITKKIQLVQQKVETPGFLLLQPLMNKKHGQIDEWVYAPFIAKELLRDLTVAQGKLFDLRIYDGDRADSKALIYGTSADTTPQQGYHKSLTIMVQQQRWHLEWTSTPEFERQYHTITPILILISGLGFTFLLGLFLLGLLLSHAQQRSSRRNVMIPLAVFLVAIVAALYLQATLKRWEAAKIHLLVSEQVEQVRQLIHLQSRDKLMALQRMAVRWEMAGGTPYALWQSDAENYVAHIVGMRAVEWIGPDYRIQWAEPMNGNRQMVGVDVRFNEVRHKALAGAEQRQEITITPPMDLVQGYKGFVAYAPLHVKGKFDGFIAGVFSVEDLLRRELNATTLSDYRITLSTGDAVFFRSQPNSSGETLGQDYAMNLPVEIYDQVWRLDIEPTDAFIRSQQSNWPRVLLISGLAIAGMLGLIMHYVLVVREKSRLLSASETTFRTAMESAPIGMAIVSLEGKWLRVNSVLPKLLGYSQEELLAIDFQRITHTDDLDADIALVQQVLEGEIDHYSMEKRYIHKQGQIIWVLLAVALVRDVAGMPQYFIAQIQDIGDRKRNEAMQKELIERLAESNTELERFAYVASHDMQEPLRMISNFSQLLVEEHAAELKGEARQFIDYITSSAERMQDMVRDLLEYARVNREQLRDEPIDTEEELRHVLDNLTALMGEKKAKVTHDALPAIHGNPVQFMRLLQNLIGNGIKYQPPGNQPHIHVGVSETDTHWQFTVRDNGLGVSPNFAKKIFEPFRRLHSWDEIKGTGIGLAICKKIVENHGGSIWVEPAEGNGSIFYFTILK